MGKKVTDYKNLHQQSFVADLHCDTVQQMYRGYDFGKRHDHYHIDLPRLKEGGVNLQIFAAFVEPALPPLKYFERADSFLKTIIEQTNQYNNLATLAKTIDDIEQAQADDKIGIMLAVENGSAISNDLDKIDYFYDLGVRYMTLTHAKSHNWCSSSSDHHAKEYGLTIFGHEVIKRMNQLGMIVDVSHISVRAFFDVLNITTKPVIASHSNVYELCQHDRNLSDNQLKAIAENNGLVAVNFVSDFLSNQTMQENIDFTDNFPKEKFLFNQWFSSLKPEAEYQKDYDDLRPFIEEWQNHIQPYLPTVEKLVDHIDYIANLIGIDHIALGSDYDGMFYPVKDMPDCSYLPLLTKELLTRGYNNESVKKILGANFLRVFKAQT